MNILAVDLYPKVIASTILNYKKFIRTLHLLLSSTISEQLNRKLDRKLVKNSLSSTRHKIYYSDNGYVSKYILEKNLPFLQQGKSLNLYIDNNCININCDIEANRVILKTIIKFNGLVNKEIKHMTLFMVEVKDNISSKFYIVINTDKTNKYCVQDFLCTLLNTNRLFNITHSYDNMLHITDIDEEYILSHILSINIRGRKSINILTDVSKDVVKTNIVNNVQYSKYEQIIDFLF